MSCYHPLKAFPIGKTVNGKIDYKVTDYSVDHLEKDKNGNWNKIYDSFVAANYGFQKSFIEVPCGQCIGCRLERSKEWANRCMMELQYHKESWFVTLTYDDEHIPYSSYIDKLTGEICDIPTLQKSDFQAFMKRLRKNYKYDNKIRFFMAGEYGSMTHRPHYHAILFGLHLDDLEIYKQSNGYTYFNSKFLNDCWHNQGFIVVAPVTWETCAYTARYITKKLTGEEGEIYSDFNIEPEFSNMSRKPGIAAQYFKDHVKAMDYEKINLSTEKGGISFKPPRYFDKLYDIDYPSDDLSFYEKLDSPGIKVADSIRRAKMAHTDLDYISYLESEEQVKNSQIKSLKRKGVL